jgi:hypothetical protein
LSSNKIRKRISEQFGEPYVALGSLAEAKQFSDGVVILEREGTILIVARAQGVRCKLPELETLARALNAEIFYERQPMDAPIFGGSDGARVDLLPWVHPSLDAVLYRGRLK